MEEKKYSIVTGSTQGIGFAIAKILLEQGHFVLLNYSQNEEAAQKCERILKEEGFTAFQIIKRDLSKLEEVEEFVKECKEISPSFSSVIFNTGITDKTPFSKVDYSQFMKVMETNLCLPFFMVQQFQENMVKGGNILFIGSSLGTYPHATSLSYGISKAGLVSLCKNLVKEFASAQVRVNIIAPGFVDTEWQKTKPPEIRASIESKIALGRFCSPEEIAQMCLSILENPYINGALIPIDGGYSYK